MSVLSATGIVAGYGERTVLQGIDLSINGGEVVAVVGPNGAGKSTLLRVLAGLLRPRRGSVSLDGRPLSAFRRIELARRIAVVPQVFETLFPFTVREVVGLGRTARIPLFGRVGRADAAAVDAALGDLEMAALADRRVDELSGGERQRAVIAMALAQEADVLLLDEPTAHLDPAHQLATLDFVRSLATRRGFVVCAVLHDLNLASALASRLVVLAAGRALRDGAPSDVLRPDLVASVFGDRLAVIQHAGRPAVLPLPPTRRVL